MALIFHRLVQKDLRTVLEYYETEGSTSLADRFFVELDAWVAQIACEPGKFHQVASGLRRANMLRFPYHFLSGKVRLAFAFSFYATTRGIHDSVSGGNE
jgi:hypothetical protein